MGGAKKSGGKMKLIIPIAVGIVLFVVVIVAVAVFATMGGEEIKTVTAKKEISILD